MNEFLKVLGAVLVFIGALILMAYYFGSPSNSLLVAGGTSMVVGIIAHILLNKYVVKD